MQYFANFICGSRYAPDWDAISSISTALAVLVALWIPARERAITRRERIEADIRAVEIVAQSLVPAIELLPKVVCYIRETNGALIDTPATNVLYGIDACREILEKEAFFHQLPTSCLGTGVLVCSLARKWCSEIDTRLQTQRNPELRALIDWQNHEFTCHLGEQLYKQTRYLDEKCESIKRTASFALLPLYKRLWRSLMK